MSEVSVLFVCMGNICRSPAAEGVFEQMVEQSGLADRVKIDSAGTIGFHAGSPADSRMRMAASRRGFELKSVSRQIQADDLKHFDFVITMDRDNYNNVMALDKAGKYSARVKHFTDYCMAHADKEVPDPYYDGDAGFEHVLDLLEDGCEHLLEAVKSQLDA